MTFSNLQEVHAKRTFPHYDRDEDGFISMGDVKNFFSDLQNRYGLNKSGPSDTELNVLELMMDLNGDGRLDLAEFTKAWTPPIPGPFLKMRFETYDLDGNGSFNLEEYKKVLAVLGQNKSDRQFQFYDMNDDGEVTIVEYTTRESKCSHLMLLRMQYNIQRTGSPGLIFDTCEDS